MAKKAYFLGDEFFASQGELVEYLKSLWSSSILGEPLSPKDEMILIDLLSMHPRSEEKFGSGVKYFYVDVSPNGNNNCFYIMRNDGHSTDFSYAKCLRGDSSSSLFKAACRTAVKEQIQSFRARFMVTAEGRKLISESELIHVDHSSPTFDHIVGRFYISRQLDVSSLELDGIGNENSSEISFKNKELEEDFARFHDKHARLEGVSRRHNLSNSKTGVRKIKIAKGFAVYVKPDEWENMILD